MPCRNIRQTTADKQSIRRWVQQPAQALKFTLLKSIGLVLLGIWVGITLAYKPEAEQSSEWAGLAPTPTLCEETIHLVASSTTTPHFTATTRPTPRPRKRVVCRQRATRYDRYHETYEDYRLDQRMTRPFGTKWRNFSADDEHGYPNN